MVSHNEIIDDVVWRISGNYNLIFKNYVYPQSDSRTLGELDIFAYQQKYQRWVYYEIKSHHSSKAHRKAQEQFNRAKDYFHKENFRGVYVTPECVKRLR